MSESAAERYLRPVLQLGRHVEGIVDAYDGRQRQVDVDGDSAAQRTDLLTLAIHETYPGHL